MSVDRADIVLPAYSIGDSSRFRFPHTSVLREAGAAKSRLTSVTGVFCDVDGAGTGFFGQNCSRSQLTEGIGTSAEQVCVTISRRCGTDMAVAIIIIIISLFI